jgi:hypothetical protein
MWLSGAALGQRNGANMYLQVLHSIRAIKILQNEAENGNVHLFVQN